MKLDKQQLSELLHITINNLNQIEKRNNLKLKLLENNYRLKEKIKEGKKVYYILQELNEEEKEIMIYKNICTHVYNTSKPREFTIYFLHRTKDDNVPKNKRELSNLSEVSEKTITKWDNTLIDKNILKKDGYYYFCIDNETNTIYECDIFEYKNFWRNKGYIKAFKDLQKKYLNNEITLTQLQLASAEIGSIITLTENKYYYRVKKYKNNKTELYNSTIELIKKIYNDTAIIKILE